MSTKARKRKAAPPRQDWLGERIAWIDRVVRALDSDQAPVGLLRACNEIRDRLCTFRDGVVLGSKLADADGKANRTSRK